MMSGRIRLLLVKDPAGDAGSLLGELRRCGCEPIADSVSTADALARALERGGWELIVSDYTMPGFSARAALAMVQERGLDTPFIVLSDTAGEEQAVEMMRAGAHDYLLKGNLTRVCSAVERELRQAQDRRGRRKAEIVQRESEARFRGIFEQAAVGIAETSLDGTLERVSPKYCAILGYTSDELIGRTFWSLTHPDDVELSLLQLQRLISAEDHPASIEKRYLRKDGTSVWVSVTPALIRDGQGKPLSFISVVKDISVHRAATQAMLESEQRYRDLVETSPDVIWSVDESERITFVSESTRRVLGFDPAEMIGRKFDQFCVSEDLLSMRALLARALRGETVTDIEGYRQRKNGIGIWIVSSAAPLRREDGTIGGVTGRTSDITRRRQAQDQLLEIAGRLKRTEQRFRSLIENAVDLILELEPSGVMRFVSPSVFRLLGYDAATLLGQSALEFVHADDARSAIEALSRTIDGAEEQKQKAPVIRIRHADGSWRSMETIGTRIGDGEQLVINARDVTDRVRLEDQFRQAQKMEAVGRLAGGVAHDFNNLLSVIISYADLMRESIAHDAAALADLEEIRRAGHRAAGLTRQLLAFSRQQVLQPRIVDLNGVVSGMEKMLCRLIGEDVEVRVVPASSPPIVRVDPGQMEQLVMNLAVNSRDAMPGGGTLTIEVTRLAVDGTLARLHPGAVPGPHVRLSVRDDGLGMDKATLERIFEPFFTTKPQGKGTGLGLSTCYGIVQQAGGFITVESEPGVGTTFRVHFPECFETAGAQAHDATESPVGGRETILVVEDEKSLRAVTARILRSKGYAVMTAADGAEALLLMQGELRFPDLILTDVVMPHMSGPQLIDLLRQKWPRVRALFMSGYTGHSELDRGTIFPAHNLLQKPFTPDTLVRTVREFLASTVQPAGRQVGETRLDAAATRESRATGISPPGR